MGCCPSNSNNTVVDESQIEDKYLNNNLNNETDYNQQNYNLSNNVSSVLITSVDKEQNESKSDLNNHENDPDYYYFDNKQLNRQENLNETRLSKIDEEVNNNTDNNNNNNGKQVVVYDKNINSNMDSSDLTLQKYFVSNGVILEWKSIISALNENETLWRYAFSKRLDQFFSIKELKQFILDSPNTCDIEKLWLIYIWITNNVKFDYYNYMSQTYKVKSFKIDMIFKNGKSLCAGYSNLFKDLCDACGIMCFNVSGFAKAYSYNVINDVLEKHAWNAVCIDGQMKLVDCAWGAGEVDRSKGFIKRFDPHYFLIPPEVAIFTHYPINTQEQYISEPYTKEQFELLPYYRNNFFLYNLKCLTHDSCAIETTSKRIELQFKAPPDVQMLAHLLINGKKLEDCVFIQRDYRTKRLVIEVSVRLRRNYVLQLFASDKKDTKFKYVTEYAIKSINLSKSHLFRFCRKFDFPIEVYLFEPKQRFLKLNKTYTFKVCVEAVDVLLIDSKKNIKSLEKLSTNPTIWSIEYAPIEIDDLKLSVKTEINSYSYYYAYKYEVK